MTGLCSPIRSFASSTGRNCPSGFALRGGCGIQAVSSINFSATMTSGCMNLVICKPIASIPITGVGIAGERDLLNQIPSFPRIYDGADLQWLYYAGAAHGVGTTWAGQVETVWG